MFTKRVRVGPSVGLHARPAALIAKRVNQLGLPVTLRFNGEEVCASSGLTIMTLGAKCGDEVEICAGDRAAVEAVAQIIGATDLRWH